MVAEAEPTPRSRAGPELAALVVGGLLALLLLQVGLEGRTRKFDDLALGDETRNHFGRFEGHAVHCQYLPDAPRCLEGHRALGGLPVALWLGNSQVQSVNDLKPGEESAPAILHQRLRPRGIHLVTLSQPNANLQEHLVLYAWLQDRLPVRQLILPVVFDDLREMGIRWNLADAVLDPQVQQTLGRSEVGTRILARHGATNQSKDLAALDQTVQEHSESALTGWLERRSDLWASRPQARGALFASLYELRNRAFGITAQTKRRMVPGRLRQNLAAAGAILDEARRNGVATLVYVVPLRSDIETPYVEKEYSRFKREIEILAREHGARFANLEDVVPGELWGRKQQLHGDRELVLDFMHFQAGGHVLLAEALDQRIDVDGAGARP